MIVLVVWFVWFVVCLFGLVVMMCLCAVPII